MDYVYFSGKAKWFKYDRPNKFGNYSHDIYLDDPSLEKFKILQKGKEKLEGIRNHLKQDEDGYYVSLNRPQSKNMRGRIVGFAPPEVLDRDNHPIKDVNVGNGSDITTKCEYYSFNKPFNQGRGSAIRWASTRVDNLVPFELNRDFDPDQEALIRDLPDQPHLPEF